MKTSSVLTTAVLCSITLLLQANGNTTVIEPQPVCEGGEVTLECPKGFVIQLVQATYGRINVRHCNDAGDDKYRGIYCMYKDTERIIRQRCEHRRICRLWANNTEFAEKEPSGCHGIPKYLLYSYICRPPVPQPQKSAGLIIGPSGPIVTSASKPPATSASPKVVGSHRFPAVSERARLENTLRPPLTTEWNEEPTEPTFCAAISRRNVNWPQTDVGKPTRRPCPNNADKFALWSCSADGVWGGSTEAAPDLSQCVSKNLEDLKRQLKTTIGGNLFRNGGVSGRETTIRRAAQKLQERSKHHLYGGDIREVVDTLKVMAEATKHLEQSKTKKRALVKGVNQAAIETLSSLLQERNELGWQDVTSRSERRQLAANVLQVVERNAELVADTAQTPLLTHTVKTNNILVQVSSVSALKSDVSDSENDRAYIQIPSMALYQTNVDSIQLPQQTLLLGQNSQVSGMTKLLYASFDKLGQYLTPKSDQIEIEGEFEPKTVKKQVVSKVLMASVAGMDRLKGLKDHQNIILTFVTRITDRSLSNPQCVWWHVETEAWRPAGCRLHSHNSTHTVCRCNHLTHFAVLMDIGVSGNVSDGHELTLIFLTYFGCTVSAVCLVLSLFAFLFLSGSCTERLTIHRHLCFSLLVAELLFLFGIMQTQNRLLCGVVAGALHYWFLAAFCWMLLEGFQLYTMLIEVYPPKYSRRWAYYLAGYGAPLLLVLGAYWYDGGGSYGTSQYCWLRADNHHALAFVLPALTVVMANGVFLAMSLVIVCRHGTGHSYEHCRHMQTTANAAKDGNRSLSVGSQGSSTNGAARAFRNIRSWLKGAIALVFLLGLTWLSGVFWLAKGSIVFAYIFTILNTLQGTFIFLFHVAFNDKIRDRYTHWSNRNSGWLPSCMRSYDLDASTRRGGGGAKRGKSTIPGLAASCECGGKLSSSNAGDFATFTTSPPVSPLPFDLNNQLLGRIRPLATGREEMDNQYNASMQRLMLRQPSSCNSGKYDYAYATIQPAPEYGAHVAGRIVALTPISGDPPIYQPTLIDDTPQPTHLFTFNPQSSTPLQHHVCSDTQSSIAHGGYFEPPFHRVPRMPPPSIPPPAPPYYDIATVMSKGSPKQLSDDSAYSEGSFAPTQLRYEVPRSEEQALR